MRKPFLTDCKRHNLPSFEILTFSIFLFIPHYKYPDNIFQYKTSYTEALYKAGERFQICPVFLYTLYITSAKL